MQKALDNLKRHCDDLGRDYDTIEKTALCTADLTGKDTPGSVLKLLKELSQMGFSHVIFNMPDVYKITPLETFAQEIIPAVADL